MCDSDVRENKLQGFLPAFFGTEHTYISDGDYSILDGNEFSCPLPGNASELYNIDCRTRSPLPLRLLSLLMFISVTTTIRSFPPKAVYADLPAHVEIPVTFAPNLPTHLQCAYASPRRVAPLRFSAFLSPCCAESAMCASPCSTRTP